MLEVTLPSTSALRCDEATREALDGTPRCAGASGSDVAAPTRKSDAGNRTSPGYSANAAASFAYRFNTTNATSARACKAQEASGLTASLQSRIFRRIANMREMDPAVLHLTLCVPLESGPKDASMQSYTNDKHKLCSRKGDASSFLSSPSLSL